MIADLVKGWAELEEAMETYLKAEVYYTGEFPEHFNSARIERLIGKTGEEFRVPLIATIVDVLAARCGITRISAPADTAATEQIEEVWEANSMAAYYPNLIKKAFMFGDAYLQVWPVYDTTETPEPAATAADEALLEVGIEFTVRDPKNCRVFYDPENQRRKSYGLIRWCLEDELEQELWRVDLFYPDHIERWISLPNSQPEDKAAWVEYSDANAGHIVANEFGEIPLFHHRTDFPYGIPVHWRGIGAQNAFTKMTVTQIATSESQGFPWRYALTDPDAELDSVSDSPDFPEDDEALSSAGDGPQSRYGGQPSPIRTAPGTLNVLQGMASVGQLPSADSGMFMDPADTYLNYLAQVGQTPLHDFQPTAQPPSGESRRIAEGPLVKRAGYMQVILRDPVVDSWKFALRILGRKVKLIHVSWTAPYVADGVDDWQKIQLQQMSGVPVKQTLIEAGYEVGQVDEWLDGAPEASPLQAQIRDIAIIAEATDHFAAAGLIGPSASAGVTGPLFEALQGLVTRVLTTTDRAT